MKKIYKNILVVSGLILVSLFTFIGMIYATTYTSSLSLDGASLTGKSRSYAAGVHRISITPTKLQTQEVKEYVNLLIKLYEKKSSSNILVDSANMYMYKSQVGEDFVENFGRLNAGNRYYYFSTYHGGVDYGLVYAPKGNVVMSSYSS